MQCTLNSELAFLPNACSLPPNLFSFLHFPLEDKGKLNLTRFQHWRGRARWISVSWRLAWSIYPAPGKKDIPLKVGGARLVFPRDLGLASSEDWVLFGCFLDIFDNKGHPWPLPATMTVKKKPHVQVPCILMSALLFPPVWWEQPRPLQPALPTQRGPWWPSAQLTP